MYSSYFQVRWIIKENKITNTQWQNETFFSNQSTVPSNTSSNRYVVNSESLVWENLGSPTVQSETPPPADSPSFVEGAVRYINKSVETIVDPNVATDITLNNWTATLNNKKDSDTDLSNNAGYIIIEPLIELSSCPSANNVFVAPYSQSYRGSTPGTLPDPVPYQ